MPRSEPDSRRIAPGHGNEARRLVVDLLAKAGWSARGEPRGSGPKGPDLLVRKGSRRYLVEIKVASEGRSDRLIPLWSQGYLQARALAGDGLRVLVVVAAPRIAERSAGQIVDFARANAPDAAAGVVDLEGMYRFQGEGLDGLSGDHAQRPARASSPAAGPVNLFSDCNQWLLKVLLAPDLPGRLLAAPRERRYRSAADLAGAAGVSPMSAHRFVRALREEHYLDQASPYLVLVRREELFSSWQAAAAVRGARERPMRFLLGGKNPGAIKRLLHGQQACLGLFAAADALHLGHVDGVPPHVYLEDFGKRSLYDSPDLVEVGGDGIPPDLILRQAPFPRSIFRGSVQVDGIMVSDILQVWLDVAAHPARGEEQAARIRKDVLAPLFAGGRTHG